MIKPYGRLVKAFIGFIYDFKRFYNYGGWRLNMSDDSMRNYHIAKTYHALEKSMAFKVQNKESGWLYAALLFDLLKDGNNSRSLGYHDRAGLTVLKQFVELRRNLGSEKHKEIDEGLKILEFHSFDNHGVNLMSEDEMLKGKLDSPEDFFLSRYSLREFKDVIVPQSDIQRAIHLAMKTPSVCNRQEWHIYHSSNESVKKAALQFQAGNKGFGDKIPNLLILGIDLKAFMPGQEHYQHWIDGGLFSMSVVYALHSIGIASCCLNWSSTPKNDRNLRKIIDIKGNHTIMMMLAVGYPDEMNKVCHSTRKPISEVLTELTKKNK